MREGRVGSRNGRDRTRRDPDVEKFRQQLRDGSALGFAVAEHLRHDHAQPLVEHAREGAIQAAPLAVRRVKEETGRQKTVLSGQKTLDRSRPPQLPFGERGARLGRGAKHRGAAGPQTLEAVQFAKFPSRRCHGLRLRDPISQYELTRALGFSFDPSPRTRSTHLRRRQIGERDPIFRFTKTPVCVAEIGQSER
ncbi:MAG TPA: hypothetical protein VKR56_12890 [Candidatus Cybelea sp.]|nr:hypothetical protein [Candidatus Cybelea sp.]